MPKLLKSAGLAFGRVAVVASMLALAGCSTISSWWSNDEEAVAKPVPVKAALITGKAQRPGGISIQWQVDLDQRQPASPSGFSLPLVIHAIGTKTGAPANEQRIIAGTQDRRVRIYDMQGHEINRIALMEPCESGAAQLANGLVVVGDVGGHLYGLDAEKGSVVWRQDLPSVLMSRPVALNQGFVIQTADNRIYRFDGNGKKQWSYIGPAGGLSMRLSPSPLLVEGQLFAAFSNGDVVALNAASGALLWKRQLILDNSAAVLSELKVPVATPVLVSSSQSGRDEDMIVAPVFQSRLSFLSRLDGSRLMDRTLSLKSSPLLLNQKLFTADGAGAVSALDLANGETLWKQQLSHGELTGPANYAGSLWVADDQGKVFSLSYEGKVLADVQLPGRIDRAPVTTSQGILVRNSLGTLFLLK